MGDRVRVILEGEIIGGPDHDGDFELSVPGIYDEAIYFKPTDEGVKSVEKIEPPVVQFQPGQIIKHKGSGNSHLVAKRGLVGVAGDRNVPGETYEGYPLCLATSGHYDLVEVGA